MDEVDHAELGGRSEPGDRVAQGEIDIAFIVPWGKFVYKQSGRWNTGEIVSRESIREYLLYHDYSSEEARVFLAAGNYPKVFGVGMFPGEKEYLLKDGYHYLNSWVPSTLTPAAGPCPRVWRILDWIVGGDGGAKEWLMHWAARKVQSPALLPKTAVILLGSPGSGKSTFGRIMREILGAKNCAVIERAALESNFNSSWVGKLFVQAEEIVSPDHMKEIGERLKMLITSDELEIEAKGQNRRKSPNHMAWLFCSNDRVSPLQIERDDRRYAVFANHAEITPEYRALVAGCFTPLDQFTESFKAEVEAFYHYLANLEVDAELVRLPYNTDARQRIISASERGHERFIREVYERGVDALVADYPDPGFMDRSEWDFGERGIKTQFLYAVYARFCQQNGYGKMSDSKFGAALSSRGWRCVRNSVPNSHSKKRPMCYMVPRTQGDDSATGPETIHDTQVAARS